MDLLCVEILPVLEVVEVHGVEDCSVVSDSDGFEDRSAGFVGVVVTNDGIVMFDNSRVVERAAFLVEDPLLKLGVGRLTGLDVVEEGLTVDTESIESHLVKAGTCFWVIAVKFADCAEGSLLPEAWKVKDAEWTGDAGGDCRNDIAHFLVCVFSVFERPKGIGILSRSVSPLAGSWQIFSV